MVGVPTIRRQRAGLAASLAEQIARRRIDGAMTDPQRCRATIRSWKPTSRVVWRSPTCRRRSPARSAASSNGASPAAWPARPFTSSVMPAGGGVLALSVSKAMMAAAGVEIGDEVELEIGLA